MAHASYLRTASREEFRDWLDRLLSDFGLPTPEAGNVKWEGEQMLKLMWFSSQREHILTHLKRALQRSNKLPEMRQSYGIHDILSGRETPLLFTRSEYPPQLAPAEATSSPVPSESIRSSRSPETVRYSIKDAARKLLEEPEAEVDHFLHAVHSSVSPVAAAAQAQASPTLQSSSQAGVAPAIPILSLAARLGPPPTSPPDPKLDYSSNSPNMEPFVRPNLSFVDHPNPPSSLLPQQSPPSRAVQTPAPLGTPFSAESSGSSTSLVASTSNLVSVNGTIMQNPAPALTERKPGSATPVTTIQKNAQAYFNSKGRELYDASVKKCETLESEIEQLRQDNASLKSSLTAAERAPMDPGFIREASAKQIAELEHLLSLERDLRLQAEKERDEARVSLQSVSLAMAADEKTDMLRLKKDMQEERDRHMQSMNLLVMTRDKALSEYRQATQNLEKLRLEAAEVQKIAELERERYRDLERRAAAERHRSEETEVERFAAKQILAELEDEFSQLLNDSTILVSGEQDTPIRVSKRSTTLT